VLSGCEQPLHGGGREPGGGHEITRQTGHYGGARLEQTPGVDRPTGPGIPADVRAQLFTPFFSTKEHGQGIGLTMVQEILENHRFEYSLDGPAGRPDDVHGGVLHGGRGSVDALRSR
jgi:hypothetical protein